MIWLIITTRSPEIPTPIPRPNHILSTTIQVGVGIIKKGTNCPIARPNTIAIGLPNVFSL